MLMDSGHRRRKEIVDRLSRIEGHVRGLRKMVEEDKSCPEVLIQAAAVRAAIDKVARIILEDHIETCMKEAVKAEKTDEYITELKVALSRFF
jgi:CsoR family transcriptional regulator, copper-sensing transcriptional repressor